MHPENNLALWHERHRGVRVLVVAGPAGSGKSTLGVALARELRAALLDLDTLTNPLLDVLECHVAPDGHWNDRAHRELIRPARYAVLRSAAADQVAAGVDVVLVAPFTDEMTGGPTWDRLVAAVTPVALEVVWLDVPPESLAARVAERGDRRDVGDNAVPTHALRPAVPHRRLDASVPTAAQVIAVLSPDPE